MGFLSQRPSCATVTGKQPQTIRKWVGRPAHQYNSTCKRRPTPSEPETGDDTLWRGQWKQHSRPAHRDQRCTFTRCAEDYAVHVARQAISHCPPRPDCRVGYFYRNCRLRNSTAGTLPYKICTKETPVWGRRCPQPVQGGLLNISQTSTKVATTLKNAKLVSWHSSDLTKLLTS